MLLALQLNNLLESAAPTATVPDVVGETQANGTAAIEAEGFVVAVATAYSSVVASGSIISQDPLAGATAVVGSTVTITVSLGEAAQPDNAGGWALFFHYEQERERRRRRKRELEEAEEASRQATQELPPVDREIAKLLHKQERIDAEREHLERLRRMVREYQPTEALPQRVSDAIVKAQARETMAALRQLDKALRRMMEEEEMAVLMLLLND